MAKSPIHLCLHHVENWMTKNILNFNDAITEFLMVSGECQNATKSDLQIGGIKF